VLSLAEPVASHGEMVGAASRGTAPDGWEGLDEAALVRVLERATVVSSKPAAAP
jgi:hypothetical protein